MPVSAQDVKALREATGLGMMECKKALEATDGDMEAAAKYVREKFGAKMASRSDRDSSEGKIGIAKSDDAAKAVIVKVNTETDFTANHEAFLAMTGAIAGLALEQGPGDVAKTDAMEAEMEKLRLTTQENIQFGEGKVLGGPGKKVGDYVHFTGKVGVLVEVTLDDGAQASDELLRDLCMHVSAVSPTPLGITAEDVPAELVEKEKAFAKQEAIDSGKPENIAEKMVEGKMRKYLDTVALLRQPFVKDDKKQVRELLPRGVSITSFVRYQVGG